MDAPEVLQQRIDELEAALEAAQKASSSSAANDAEVDQLVAMAEKALLDREELELVVERQKQAIADVQLRSSAELLEQEVQVADLQAKLAEVYRLKESNTGKDAVIEELQRQNDQFRPAFEALKKLCVESAATGKSTEAELNAQITRTHELESQLNECRVLMNEQSHSLQSFQQMTAVDNELIEKSAEVEKLLRSSLAANERELASYKEAFQRLSKLAIEKEGARVTEIAGLKAKVESLEETVRRDAALLVPRWQRLADEKAKHKVGSPVAAALKGRDTELSSLMLQSGNRFLISCIPSEIWAAEMQIYNVGSILAKLVYKANNFLDYVFEAHYVELIADVEENPASVQKDRGFVRWLHNAVTVSGAIMTKAAMLLEALRCSSLDDVNEYLKTSSSDPLLLERAPTIGTPTKAGAKKKGSKETDPVGEAPVDCALLRCLQLGDERFDRLLDAAENDYLSSSFELGVLESFISELAEIMKAGEATAVGSTVSAARSMQGAPDFGILPPVLSASMRTLASVAVVGLCNAAYRDNLTTTLGPDVWTGLWQISSHIVDRVPFGRGAPAMPATECLYSGFGFLQLARKRNDRASCEAFFVKIDTAIDGFQKELLQTSETPLADVADRLNALLPTIGSAVARIDKMCTGSFVPASKGSTSPWEEAVTHVLTRVCAVTEVEQALQQLKSNQQRKDEEIKRATEDLGKARQEREDLRVHINELQTKTGRMMLYEKEVQELRASDAHCAKLIAEQRVQLDQSEKQKKSLTEEVAQLNNKIKETISMLEATKQLSRHQHQSEWDAIEIANLRAINTKLERELLAAQMENVDADLDISDLAVYLPLSTDTADTGPDSLSSSSGTSAVTDASAAASVRKMTEDYQALRSSVLTHILAVPLFKPHMTPEELAAATKKYQEEQSALRLQLSVLQTRMDGLSQATSNLVPSQRFLRPATAIEGKRPVARITVPEAPWSPITENICKLTATTAQLAELNKKLIGTF